MVLRGKLRGRVGSRRDYIESPREHLFSRAFTLFRGTILFDSSFA
jgi:hypothetical protein